MNVKNNQLNGCLKDNAKVSLSCHKTTTLKLEIMKKFVKVVATAIVKASKAFYRELQSLAAACPTETRWNA